jgi:hypothetical protein
LLPRSRAIAIVRSACSSPDSIRPWSMSPAAAKTPSQAWRANPGRPREAGSREPPTRRPPRMPSRATPGMPCRSRPALHPRHDPRLRSRQKLAPWPRSHRRGGPPTTKRCRAARDRRAIDPRRDLPPSVPRRPQATRDGWPRPCDFERGDHVVTGIHGAGGLAGEDPIIRALPSRRSGPFLTRLLPCRPCQVRGPAPSSR